MTVYLPVLHSHCTSAASQLRCRAVMSLQFTRVPSFQCFSAKITRFSKRIHWIWKKSL